MPLSTEHILTLLKTPKIGPVSVKAINSNADYKLSGLIDLYELIVETKKTNAKIPLPDLAELEKAFISAQQIIEKCDHQNISIITVNDKSYPIKLFKLPDHPILTYVKGNIDALNSKLSAAVIGTREPSSYGFKLGRRISTILAKNGFSIISGLAVGCDTAGHLGATDIQAPTVAVLASGVDIIYPKENTALAEKILDCGGALFSEYEVGFRPQRSTFVERDRLQSGLSDGLLVVETDIQGGTMHAVNAARRMNMTIGCLANHPENLSDFPKIRGNKLLISEGALPISNQDQIWTFIKKMNPEATEFVNDEKVRLSNNVQAITSASLSEIEPNEKTPTSVESAAPEISEKKVDDIVTNQMLMDGINELKEMVTTLAWENQLLREQLENTGLLIESKVKPNKIKTTIKPKNQPKLL